MYYRYFIWDFDGMLFDSYPHTTEAAWKVLRKRGESPDPEILYFDLRRSIAYATGKYAFTPAEKEQFYLYENDYDALPLTIPYSGIPELLEGICRQGGKNLLLTNRDQSALYYLDRYRLTSYFTEIVDRTFGFPLKPQPDGMKYFVEKYHDGGKFLSLGDREWDAIAAKLAGADALFFDQFGLVEKSCADYLVRDISSLSHLVLEDCREDYLLPPLQKIPPKEEIHP